VSRRRVVGALVAALGLGLALAVQIATPVAVPLYDGVVPVEPYRFLHPTGDQQGDPTSFTSTPAATGNESPFFAAATAENPPQAQLIVEQGAFRLSAGTSQLQVSITPVDPVAQPTEGTIAGNVYRFTATDSAGTSLVPNQCDGCRTMVLRAPDGVTDGTIGHFENGAWAPIHTLPAGVAAMFQVNVDAMGDFGVITGGPGGGSNGPERGLVFGLDPLFIGVGALAVLLVAIAGLFWYRRRPAPVHVAELRPRQGRVPSKRRSRRPPSGRS
jgi:hypothetical protein